MNCFDNIIGCRGIVDENDVTFFIDQCGITSDLLAKTNYTNLSVKDLFTQKMGEATDMLARQIIGAKQTKILAADSLVQKRIGYPARSRSAMNAKTGKDVGIKIELLSDASYVKINIDSISLFSQNTGNVTVVIYDLTTGQTLDTLTLSSVSGEISTLSVNKSYSAPSRNMALGIMYDSNFAYYKTTTLENQNCRDCGPSTWKHSQYTRVGGIECTTGDTKILASMNGSNDTGGLSVFYSVQCDYQEWICKNRSVLSLPALYATAKHISEYMLVSPRLNSKTTDEYKVLESINEQATENFNREFDAVMNNIVTPANHDCFSCRKQAKNRITL
jgi:hypothetical protein